MKTAILFALLRLFATVAILGLAFAASTALAQEPASHAGLIVDYGGSRVETRCVSFTQESLTGVDLLLQSGLAVGMESGGMGVQVCRIEDVGCEPGREPCWCQCLSSPCNYWTYFQWKDGAWDYAPLGASSRELRNGDVDAWVWGDGKTPPASSPDVACAAEVEITAQPQTEATVASADTAASATDTPVPAAPAATPEPASSPGFGCSSPALVLVPLTLLAVLTVWRR